MTGEASTINDLYLQEMYNAAPASVLGRLRDLWWPHFIRSVHNEGPKATLDKLDCFMDAGNAGLLGLARAHADATAGTDLDQHRQRSSQFLKSNTGKMFERFVGLALAHCLQLADAPYAVMAFRNDSFAHCHNFSREDFDVKFKFGDGTLRTTIDADIFAFNPSDSSAEVFMISVKSTLKDRFHNVPFWNLMRRAAISDDFPEMEAVNRTHLARMKYVAVCSDLAKEQPDFRTASGARNLLKIDASMLDGAYVTASNAKGLPNDSIDHLGDIRQHAFYRYSCFYEYLSASS